MLNSGLLEARVKLPSGGIQVQFAIHTYVSDPELSLTFLTKL